MSSTSEPARQRQLVCVVDPDRLLLHSVLPELLSHVVQVVVPIVVERQRVPASPRS